MNVTIFSTGKLFQIRFLNMEMCVDYKFEQEAWEQQDHDRKTFQFSMRDNQVTYLGTLCILIQHNFMQQG